VISFKTAEDNKSSTADDAVTLLMKWMNGCV